jgi:hypothetical protein
MMGLAGMLAAIAMAACCWGMYGPVLHHGRELMHSALRPFVCVGVAYFVIAVLAPLVVLFRGGEKGSWSMTGVAWSLFSGAAGALGALGVILALSFGGKPIYVMPLVFGGAPVVNTLLTAAMNRAFNQIKAPFLAGLILVISGAVTVLVFKPQPPAKPAVVEQAEVANEASEASESAVGGEAAESQPSLIATATAGGERFLEILLSTAMALVCWGAYGCVLHKGQSAMGGSRLRPLICIGVSYFLIAVLVPMALIGPMGDTGTWDVAGGIWSLAGGALGAIGALGIILAFNCGGKPFTVMPVVFGLAIFLAGLLVVAVGAATVLVFGPRGHAKPKSA